MMTAGEEAELDSELTNAINALTVAARALSAAASMCPSKGQDKAMMLDFLSANATAFSEEAAKIRRKLASEVK